MLFGGGSSVGCQSAIRGSISWSSGSHLRLLWALLVAHQSLTLERHCHMDTAGEEMPYFSLIARVWNGLLECLCLSPAVL